MARHGLYKSREYNSWALAKQRCYNKNHWKYPIYGARGIKMSSRWRKDFVKFYEDMGPRPNGKTLGRINNNLGYKKSNCRWETPLQQVSNRSSSRIFIYKGKNISLGKIAKLNGFSPETLRKKIVYQKMTLKEAIKQIKLIKKRRK